MLLAHVADDRIFILQQVQVSEWVRLVWHFLVRFCRNLLPIVRGLVLHEDSVFLESVEGGSELSVTLEYLSEEVARNWVHSLFIQLDLTS